MWKSNHTSCTLCLSLYVHNKSTSEIFFKLWKIINLKTLLKNEKELKRTKVRSIRKQAGKICGGCWRIFAQKNFYQDKRVILQLEIWKGAVNHPIRSRGQGFEKKIGNSSLLDSRKSNFQGLEHRDWKSCYGFYS